MPPTTTLGYRGISGNTYIIDLKAPTNDYVLSIFNPLTNQFGSGVYFNTTPGDSNWYGPDGLPPIASNITIDGGVNGAIIERPEFIPRSPFGAAVAAGGDAELPPVLRIGRIQR